MDDLVVFWTQTAKYQRDHVFDYWNKRNKNNNYSKKLNLLITERTDLLKSHPKMGKETDFAKTRVIALRHYSIFYQIQLARIIITGFWDNRQDPKELLNLLQQK